MTGPTGGEGVAQPNSLGAASLTVHRKSQAFSRFSHSDTKMAGRIEGIFDHEDGCVSNPRPQREGQVCEEQPAGSSLVRVRLCVCLCVRSVARQTLAM